MKSFVNAVKISLAAFVFAAASWAAPAAKSLNSGKVAFNPPRIKAAKAARLVEVLVTRPSGLSVRARSAGLMALQFGDSAQSLWEESDYIGLSQSYLQDQFQAQPVGLVNRIDTLIYHVPA